MINMTNVLEVLPILMQDDEIFDRLKHDFPGILADLVTFKDNPNCTCRGRVFKFFIDRLQLDSAVLDQYVKDPVAMAIKIQELNKDREANNYSGRIVTIKRDEEAWRALSRELVGKMFRTVSVVEREHETVVYFL